MISSSRATRKVHSLPPLPDSARICGCEHASTTIGTPISLTTGIAPRQAPLCVCPMMTSTLSTSASLRTALTASPGCALLSAKYASSLRPITPPFALISSTAIVAPQRTPSPVIAAGPLMADAEPMRMGGCCARPAYGSAARSTRTTVSTTRMEDPPELGEMGNDLAPEELDRLLHLGHCVGDEQDAGERGDADTLVESDALGDLRRAA